MQPGGEGQLDVEGDDPGDISIIFFIPGQYRQVHATIIYPENPFLDGPDSHGTNKVDPLLCKQKLEYKNKTRRIRFK